MTERVSRELRAIRAQRNLRGWSPRKFLDSLTAQDCSFAEALMGGLVIGVRGFSLVQSGWVYPAAATALNGIGWTATRVGWALLILCAAQVLVSLGTCWYVTRALISFALSVICFAIFSNYLGAGAEVEIYSRVAERTWFSFMLAEMILCWRVLLLRRVLDGYGLHEGPERRGAGEGEGA